MNIKIKGDKASHLGKICNEMKMNPSQVMEYLLDIVQNLYSDYERQKEAEVEKESFREILTNLFSHSFKSNLRTLNVAENLIESTNEVLGIKEYVCAIVHNINPDFYERSVSYSIGYEYCIGSSNSFAYRGLLIEVKLSQDYIEVSHVVYLPTFESMDVTDKRIDHTSSIVQEFFKDLYHVELSPFVNIEIKILPIRVNPYNLSEPVQSIGIKLVVKADKAENIPSIEKISQIAGRVHSIVTEELHLNKWGEMKR
jgi:hypothetical protein